MIWIRYGWRVAIFMIRHPIRARPWKSIHYGCYYKNLPVPLYFQDSFAVVCRFWHYARRNFLNQRLFTFHYQTSKQSNSKPLSVPAVSTPVVTIKISTDHRQDADISCDADWLNFWLGCHVTGRKWQPKSF